MTNMHRSRFRSLVMQRRFTRRVAAMVFSVTAVVAIATACDTPSDRNELMGEDYATETDIRTTAVKLFEAMSRNDWDQYNRLQCSQQRSDAPVDPGLARKMSRLEVVGVNVKTRTDTSAQVDVEFHYSDEPAGTNHTEEVTVVREGDEWLAC